MAKYLETTFRVYTLDMWMNEYDDWEENARYYVGKITIRGKLDRRKVIKALLNLHVLNPMINTRKLYFEDYYGGGTWYEVGYRKTHEPFLGLSLVEE